MTPPKPDERGSTRPKTLLVLVATILLGGLAVLLAQGLRVTSVKDAQPGQIAIEYQNDAAGRFRLLRGSTVTNIATPVATNDAHANSGRSHLLFSHTQPPASQKC